VSYQRSGEGPALVLLYGFTHDSRVRRAQLESLSDLFTVMAWDAPGAGRMVAIGTRNPRPLTWGFLGVGGPTHHLTTRDALLTKLCSIAV